MFESDTPNHGYKTYSLDEEPIIVLTSKMNAQSANAVENASAAADDFNSLLSSIILSWTNPHTITI